MNVVHFIETRRDNGTHTRAELFEFAKGVADGTIPDYQASAWLMAAFLNPLSDEETAWLTEGMADSGDRIDLSGVPEPWVDKHSTGGVGDKTTLVAAPVLAACGLAVVKMSGRGLGITGGTIDKLESIPGFRTDLSPDELKAQAIRIGIALAGQTANLAPADKALYALRDVTGTTASMPLMASSILSKKVAGGAQYVTLDIKCGRGAFMPNLPEAKRLADLLTRIGNASGLKTTAVITDMDVPLGSAIGNAVEVREAWQVLQNSAAAPASARFRAVVQHVVETTLRQLGRSASEANEQVTSALESGQAWEFAERWIIAQGGSNPNDLPVAPNRTEILADRDGFLADIEPTVLARAVIDLGGGRKSKADKIDHAVGIEVLPCIGDRVSAGEPLAIVHHRGSFPSVREAFTLTEDKPEHRPVVLG